MAVRIHAARREQALHGALGPEPIPGAVHASSATETRIDLAREVGLRFV